MKSIKAILFAILFIVFYSNAYSITAKNIPVGITDAFKNGNSKELATYFNNNIEITLLETEGIYSKSQAEQILADFFKKYPPKNFQMIHRGGKERSNYAICEFYSGEKKFRVTIYLKEINNE